MSIATSTATPTGTYQITVVFSETLPGLASALVILPVLLLPLMFARRRLARKGALAVACLGAILLAGASALSGCGGSSVPSTVSSNPTHQATSSGAVSLTIQ